MTTIIRVHCPGCSADLTLVPGEVLLTVGPGDATGYRFICRQCQARVAYPANPRLVFILRTAGVPILQITDEAITAVPNIADPITPAEVFGFADAMDATDTPQDELTQ